MDQPNNAGHLFCEKWWETKTAFSLKWMGIMTIQNPLDVWVIQEIVFDVKPEVIVEIGTFAGGSAAMWASILQQVTPDGRVVTVDVENRVHKPSLLPIHHSSVDFLIGSSVDPDVVADVARRVEGKRTMIILDSEHTRDHVLAEIQAYAPLVTPGSYLVVQDTFVNGHPIEPEWGPGPYEAVEDFLASDDRFEIDETRERLMFTYCPKGFLRRKMSA